MDLKKMQVKPQDSHKESLNSNDFIYLMVEDAVAENQYHGRRKRKIKCNLMY